MKGVLCRRVIQRLVPSVTNSLQCQPQVLVSKPRGSYIQSVWRLMSAKGKFEVINIQDEEDFKKNVEMNKTPVVVDFHATWCGPCKQLAPRLETIIAEKAGKVVLAKVDIDNNVDLAMRFGVRSVPMVIGIKGGKPMGQFIGLQEDDIIDSFVEKLIN